MTERFSTKKLVLSALFAALACVATMSIRIPTPGTGGYIHPGDAIVILCGVFLDPRFSFFIRPNKVIKLVIRINRLLQ